MSTMATAPRLSSPTMMAPQVDQPSLQNCDAKMKSTVKDTTSDSGTPQPLTTISTPGDVEFLPLRVPSLRGAMLLFAVASPIFVLGTHVLTLYWLQKGHAWAAWYFVIVPTALATVAAWSFMTLRLVVLSRCALEEDEPNLVAEHTHSLQLRNFDFHRSRTRQRQTIFKSWSPGEDQVVVESLASFSSAFIFEDGARATANIFPVRTPRSCTHTATGRGTTTATNITNTTSCTTTARKNNIQKSWTQHDDRSSRSRSHTRASCSQRKSKTSTTSGRGSGWFNTSSRLISFSRVSTGGSAATRSLRALARMAKPPPEEKFVTRSGYNVDSRRSSCTIPSRPDEGEEVLENTTLDHSVNKHDRGGQQQINQSTGHIKSIGSAGAPTSMKALDKSIASSAPADAGTRSTKGPSRSTNIIEASRTTSVHDLFRRPEDAAQLKIATNRTSAGGHLGAQITEIDDGAPKMLYDVFPTSAKDHNHNSQNMDFKVKSEKSSSSARGRSQNDFGKLPCTVMRSTSVPTQMNVLQPSLSSVAGPLLRPGVGDDYCIQKNHTSPKVAEPDFDCSTGGGGGGSTKSKIVLQNQNMGGATQMDSTKSSSTGNKKRGKRGLEIRLPLPPIKVDVAMLLVGVYVPLILTESHSRNNDNSLANFAFLVICFGMPSVYYWYGLDARFLKRGLFAVVIASILGRLFYLVTSYTFKHYDLLRRGIADGLEIPLRAADFVFMALLTWVVLPLACKVYICGMYGHLGRVHVRNNKRTTGKKLVLGVGGFDGALGRGYRTRDRHYSESMNLYAMVGLFTVRAIFARVILLRANNWALVLCVLAKDVVYFWFHFLVVFSTRYQEVMTRAFMKVVTHEDLEDPGAHPGAEVGDTVTVQPASAPTDARKNQARQSSRLLWRDEDDSSEPQGKGPALLVPEAEKAPQDHNQEGVVVDDGNKSTRTERRARADEQIRTPSQEICSTAVKRINNASKRSAVSAASSQELWHPKSDYFRGWINRLSRPSGRSRTNTQNTNNFVIDSSSKILRRQKMKTHVTSSLGLASDEASLANDLFVDRPMLLRLVKALTRFADTFLLPKDFFFAIPDIARYPKETLREIIREQNRVGSNQLFNRRTIANNNLEEDIPILRDAVARQENLNRNKVGSSPCPRSGIRGGPLAACRDPVLVERLLDEAYGKKPDFFVQDSGFEEELRRTLTLRFGVEVTLLTGLPELPSLTPARRRELLLLLPPPSPRRGPKLLVAPVAKDRNRTIVLQHEKEDHRQHTTDESKQAARVINANKGSKKSSCSVSSQLLERSIGGNHVSGAVQRNDEDQQRQIYLMTRRKDQTHSRDPRRPNDREENYKQHSSTAELEFLYALTQAKVHRAFVVRAYTKLYSSLMILASAAFYTILSDLEIEANGGEFRIQILDAICENVERGWPIARSLQLGAVLLAADVAEIVIVQHYHRRSPYKFFIEHYLNSHLFAKLPRHARGSKWAALFYRTLPFMMAFWASGFDRGRVGWAVAMLEEQSQ